MIKEFLANQLKKPTGFLGGLVSKVMISTNKRAYETVVKKLDIQPGDHLYEIGYGPGIGIELIRKRGIPCKISGIDFSELMCKAARQRHLKSIQQGSVYLTYGDFITAPVEAQEYKKIFAVNVIYFWPDLLPPCLKIYAMLLPKGQFFIFMRDKDYLEKKKLLSSGVFQTYTVAQVEKVLTSAGFSNVTFTHDAEGYFIQATK